MARGPRIFYGWYVVAVSFLTLGVSLGLWFGFSVFLVALIEEFGQSRGITAGAAAFNAVIASAVLPFIGRLFDRFGARRMLPAACAVLALSLILSSMARSIWEFYFAYGVIGGVGFISLGFVPHTALISNWFRRQVGLALGLAFSGVGIGTAVAAPACQYLVDLWGWRPTLALLGGLVLVVLTPLTAWVQIPRPEEIGLLPDGEAQRGDPAPSPASASQDKAEVEPTYVSRSPAHWTLAKAMAEFRFWYLFAGLFCGGYALQAVQTHHVALLTDVGIAALTAAFFFSVLSVCRMGGQLFWGALSDRYARGTTYIFSSACLALGIVFFMFVRSPTPILLVYVYAALFGFGSGALSSVLAAMSTDLYRGGHFGVIFGVQDMGFMLGAAAGSWISGVLFDASGNYQLALTIAALAVPASCATTWLAITRRVQDRPA